MDDRFYDFEEKSSDIATAIGIVLVILMAFVVLAMLCNQVNSNPILSLDFKLSWYYIVASVL